ncbi:MAG: DUF1003 domain-containing protein [Gemmatimonadota bacterium]
MGKEAEELRRCAVCGGEFPEGSLIPGALVRDEIADAIRSDIPTWSDDDFICPADLARYRAQYVHAIMESERGELSDLERQVLESLEEHDPIAMDVDAEFEEDLSFGDRLADRVAEFGGSWAFIGWFTVLLIAWIVMNSLVLYFKPVDPYPFILLNLVLSCLAAVQAPIIMMSQNRQEAKERLVELERVQLGILEELEARR